MTKWRWLAVAIVAVAFGYSIFVLLRERSRVPVSIEVTAERVAQPPRVRRTPATWCAQPRTDEPLLRDAIDIGAGADPMNIRDMNKLPKVPRSSIAVVQDEAVCEAAVRAHDTLNPDPENPDRAYRPVLVVRVGDIYLVDDMGDRGKGLSSIWHVEIFDRSWKQLCCPFGAGA